MNQHQFAIDQLRKDKIIYATEATATSVTGLVALAIASSAQNFQILSYYVGYFVVGYWLYVMIGNFFRLRKIKQLEAQL